MNDPSWPASPVGSVVDHATVQSPAGGGLRRAAVTVSPSSLTLGGFSIDVNGLPLQPIEIFASPTASVEAQEDLRRRSR